MIYTVAIVGLISMFFAAMPQKQFKYGLEVAWLILFVFLAIRYDFGNDYMAYYDDFEMLNSYAKFGIDSDAHNEPGWQILCHLFNPLGFFAMVAFLTAIECYVLYRFIKEYVPERYYWFAIFLYVFTPSIMLVGASMMRNMLAITLVIVSMKYIKSRKIVPFVALIFVASQIHSSAIILYPLFLLGYIQNVRVHKWVYGIIIVAYMALSAASAHLTPIINDIATLAGEEETVEVYTMRAQFSETNTGVGVILQMILFMYLVLTLYRYNGAVRILFLMLILGTFVVPFASVIPMIGRYMYYFNIFSIVCYPIVWGGVKDRTSLDNKPIASKNRLWDMGAISVTVLLTLYSYLQFFQNPIWVDKFSTYYTIFSV